ncbi:sensor histidine kinase [Paraclostridium sordellii]|uniref:histidine kinase n=1 Tax=Paraclostridium sordellii TaxID=1505 RepID=A0A9P1L156_PARSO|nr:HAMP domain-containing sensor histidine kinase [Paeniclostridium sordellii]EPZ56079.1 his Kinase A domain protein [[Clostridium] sordellii VPI 9048] [Paeniclostridium sordellii VPI 9048]MDU1453855.1 HAMP domain-containing sensor histidine kinase [Paeniclostridium sordellii]MDU2148066.1 HAMP domain-containing sensor histidine kinase [Paeniclostridium sordellii]CEK33835.1 sensory transduction protein kinase,Alkaline phosphatase synthesis sensor protein phoR,sensory histidine kinase CreC,Predic
MIGLILVALLITSVYFSTRFFVLSRSINNVTKDFKYISKNVNSNRKLKLNYPEKHLEQLLLEINKYLEDTQIYKQKYIKREEEIRKEIENISHDLRTPLTSIRGYLELIKDEDIPDKEKKEYIYIIEKRAKVLQNLIQDFYDLSRLENNDYNFSMEIIDINKELKEQILMFYNDFDKNNIDVDIKLKETPILVYLDKNAIERVFHNLIQNATKYSKSKFCMLLNSKNGEIIIEFKNDVQDMNRQDLDLLFNRFYMKDSSRSKDSSGLGLTITKFLIESMNGKIDIELDNEWITFRIKFLVSK